MLARKIVQVDPEDIPNEAQREFIKTYKGSVSSLKPMTREIVVDVCEEDLDDAHRYFDRVWNFVLTHLPINDNTIHETLEQRLARIKPGNPRPVTEADAIEFLFALKCLKATSWDYNKAEHCLVNHVWRHITYLRGGIRYNDKMGRWYVGTSEGLDDWLREKIEQHNENLVEEEEEEEEEAQTRAAGIIE